MRQSENENLISILVACYNPELKKLFVTLKSIIYQSGVNLEIIIADDGSSYNYFDELDNFFKNHQFLNYKIVKNKENRGTVHNIYSGLVECKGKYTKLISPGDLLYSSDTMSNWMKDVRIKDSLLSFGNPVYYEINNNVIKPVIHMAWPQNIEVYKGKYRKESKDFYLLANDTIHGVSIIVNTKLFRKYIKEITDKVKFAEDCVYRIMAYDKIRFDYYDCNVVLYEFGVGISTNVDNKWNLLLQNDVKATDEIIIKRSRGTLFEDAFINAIDFRNNKKISAAFKLFIRKPYILLWKIRTKFNRRLTSNVIDLTFFDKCKKI